MLRFESITKRFSPSRPPALDGVSFHVAAGEIFGLLGHNGAGKSTAMGILLGLVRPDRGSAWIDGIEVQRNREIALARTGSIFESPRFYEYLTGWQNLEILTGYSGFWDEPMVCETLDWLGLTAAIHRKVGTYSQGMRQRLALAQALLPRPKVLLLDEPTSGLDPDGIIEFRKRISQLRSELGMTVLLNSHHLAEVEQLCDRVLILREGRSVFEGSPSGLAGNGALYELNTDNWPAASTLLIEAGFPCPEAGKIEIPAGRDPSDVPALLIRGNLRVREFKLARASLESLYLEVSRL